MGLKEATVIARAADARRLGRYVLVGEIAEGGMGRIYLARVVGHAGFERLVALKVMHQRLMEQSPDLADMFLDEARITSLIRHPNVCAVHDFGDAQGVRYLVMEYMIGQTMLEVLRRLHELSEQREHPMFFAYAARVIAEACEGLHAAHVAVDETGQPLGVVHRDISPENVFMTYQGAVKVFDFGIARAAGRRHQTQAGMFKGKFSYASPEAYGGGLDARSDIWSMGVVLWELLAGRPLFHRATEAEILGAIFRDPIPPPSAVRRGIPPELDAIVMRTLEREPSQRYQSARDIARDLNRVAVRFGEHVGTAELGEWMRVLFPGEHERALETGRALQRLDSSIEAAPALQPGSSPGIVSQVVSRAPVEDVHAQPTVISDPGYVSPGSSPGRSPQGRGASGSTAPGYLPPPSQPGRAYAPIDVIDDDEATALAQGPIVEEVLADTPSHTLGAPAPFPAVSEAEGAPSPFHAPPPADAKPKRPALGPVGKIALALLVLVGVIFAADYFANGTTPAPRVANAAPDVTPSTDSVDEDVSGATPSPGHTPDGPVVGEDVDDDPIGESVAPDPEEAARAAEREREAEREAERERERDAARARERARHSGDSQRPRMRATMEPTDDAPQIEAGEPGHVNVAAVGGWGDIYEGGTRLGRTPARLTLPPGRHTLTIRPPEGDPKREVVRVPPGGTVSVQVDLE